MKKYESYKIISEPWIGNIPSHWIKSRVGRHFKIERGRVISKEEIQDNIGDYPVYSSQTSNNGELGRISTYDFDGEYVTWTTDGEKTGTCFHRTGKFNTTNVCGMLSVRESTPYSLKYLNYYLNQVTRPYVRLDINPKLMNNMMSEIPLIIPSIQEQHQIVQFLDEKTELIDKLISTKERKISLLKEQRTSFINQVVTKGLNPNVKMKDSGVEWIGEIPEGWSVIKLKYVGKISSGDTLESSKIEPEGLYPVYGGNGIMGYYSNFNYSHSVLSIGRVGEKCGNVHKVVSKSWINDNSLVLDFNISKFNFDYLFHTITTRNLNVLRNQNTQPLITGTIVKNEFIPYPDFKTQNLIIEHINFKTKEIDDLVHLEQKKIDTLKEYRQSLISEVVTGKIKVTTDE